MTTKKKILLAAGIVLLVAAVAILLGLLLPSCGQQDAPAPKDDSISYTVQVKNANEQPFAGVGVYIYEDETQAELVWYDTTNENGEMFFTGALSDTYVAVLDDVPQGYATEEFYPLTGERTEIILRSGIMTEEDMQALSYSLGDVMMDFTIVDTDGVEHTLSELLKTKKAVVLNFWFIECQPCNLEFPFMEEAYALYKDDIEILALNPINTDEASIAAFKEQLGLSFPVAMVDELWAQMMNVKAYPTTVVIDRFGNISLVHTGMINDTQTFVKVFNYFTADDYEPVAINSIDEIEDIKNGTADNPAMISGGQEYNITVAPEETYYFDLIKLTGTVYLTIEGEDFTLLYNGKEYKPENGSLTLTIKSEGPSTPVPMQLTNNSDKEQTFLLYLNSPKGSYGNPYTMKLGEFTAKTKAGDEQGTYYIYTAEKSGTLTVKCLSSSVSRYGFFLYNLNSYAMRNTDEDGKTDEEGYLYTSVQVKKGQKIQFNVAVGRDDSNNIAAGTFKFLASLEEGDGEEEDRIVLPETTYSLTVTDENGAPMSGVSVHFKGSLSYTPPVEEDSTEEGTGEENTEEPGGDAAEDPGDEEVEEPTVYTQEIDQYVTTDENGIAAVTGLPGTVTATVRVPDGYKLGTTKYTLTEEAPETTVQLAKIVYADYTVTVNYPDGSPVEDVLVIVGSGVGYTGAEGKVTFSLEEGAYTALILGTPEDYVLDKTSYPMDTENNTVTVKLRYGLGHETNPIVVQDALSLETGDLEVGEKICYTVYGVGGSTLTLGDYDAYIVLNGETIKTNPISVQIPEDQDSISLHVGNEGRFIESYTVNFEYPLGHVRNPAQMTGAFTNMLFDLAEGYTEGYYWTKDSTGTGTITFSFRSGLSASENCVLTISSGGQSVVLSSADKTAVTLPVTKDAPIQFHLIAVPDGETYGALNFRVRGTTDFEAEPEGVTYAVTVQNEEAVPQSGVAVQFLKDGAVVSTATTNASGVAEVVLEAGSYTVAFQDETIICDTSAVVLTEEEPAVTLTVTRTQEPVEEGKTRYSVTVMDSEGGMIGDVVVLFMYNGTPAGHAIVGSSGGAVTMDLATGVYDVQLAFLGDVPYYYEDTTAKVTETAPALDIYAATALDAEGEEHYELGTLTPVQTGSCYIVTQTDALTFYSFNPTEQGVYYISVSDPNAVLSYWGQAAYISGDLSDTLDDYTPQGFSVEINTNALGRNLVIGVTGTEDTILTIVRTGDAEEDAEYEIYVPATEPTQISLPSGLAFTKVDLTAATDTYALVLNEEDGYYHIGSADGPVMYIQLTFNNVDPDNAVAPSYIHLYDMVGGVGNTGTGFKCIYTDSEGNEHYEDYTQALLSYGACADATYGVYPLTEDLAYILQMGGGHIGWWDAEDENNRLFEDEDGNLDTTINLEIAWLFAGCYIEEVPATLSLEDDAEPAEDSEGMPAEEPAEDSLEDTETEGLLPEAEEPVEEPQESEDTVPEQTE